MEELAERIIKRYERLDADKGTLKAHLQEIAEYMAPSMASITTQGTLGAKRMTNVFDSTALRAVQIWTNGLYGHLTPPSTPWFALTTKNKGLKDRWEVKDWLSDTSTRMMDTINSSNFGMQIQDVYKQLGVFGTPVMYVEEGKRDVLNFKTFHVGRVVIDESNQGMIDTVIRLEKFTARQCFQEWPEAISEVIKKAKENDSAEKFEILHAVFPREEYDRTKKDKKNMQYASVYLEKASGNILSEGGYPEFPYMVPRAQKDSDEIYGRSPGMDALPDVKMINAMSKADIKAHQKMADPPIMAPDEMRFSPMRMKPGGISYYKSGGKPEYWNQPTTIKLAMEYEDQRRRAVMEVFFSDLFLLLANAPPGMTATEVLERAEERLILLGPTLGRLKSELFDPMLSRVFWIMYRAGYIAPPPMILVNQGLEIEYVSKLAMAMRAFETRAMSQTMGLVGPWLQIRPEIIDVFNLDNAARGTAERAGVPTDWINPEAQVKKTRELRAQAQAAAQKKEEEARAMEQVVKAGPALLKSPEEGSIVNALTGGGQGQ